MHKFPHELNLTATQLRAVLKVADCRSFVAAAHHLRLSQPALTRTVKRVEGLLGVELFSRTTRQCSLTRAGEEFATLARRLLKDLTLGIEHVRMLQAGGHGQVFVSSVLPLNDPSLAGSVAHYCRSHQNVELHLRQGLQSQIMDDVRTGGVDFAIGYIEGESVTVLAEFMRRERFFVVAPRSDGLPDRRVMDLRSLRDARLVSFPPDSHTRRLVDRVAHSLGLSLHYSATVNQRAALLELVRHGAGLAVMPGADCPDPEDQNFAVRMLANRDLKCEIGFLSLRERPLSGAATMFKGWLRNWVLEKRGLRLKNP